LAEDKIEAAFLDLLIQIPLLSKALTINLAGTPRTLRSNDKSIMQTLSLIVGHLECRLPSSIAVNFLEVNTALKLPWVWENGSYESRHIKALVDPTSASVVIWHKAQKCWWILFKTFEISDTTPEKLRILLQIIAPRGTAAIHGGTVSWLGSGVLITAKGGSGKSSSVVGSLNLGAKTIGDDFLLSSPTSQWQKGGVSLWSLFKTVRLSSTSPAHHLLSQPMARVSKNKDLFDLELCFPGSIEQSTLVKVIVVPLVSDAKTVTRISAKDAFAALAPSSVGLSLNRQQAVRDMQLLCDILPAFQVTMTRDLEDNAQRLRDLTER